MYFITRISIQISINLGQQYLNILILYSSCYPSETRLASFLTANKYKVFLEELHSSKQDDLLALDIHIVINRVYSRDVAKCPQLADCAMNLIRDWQNKGVFVLNGLHGTQCDLDKMIMYRHLVKANIATPTSLFFKTENELNKHVKAANQNVNVLKPSCGGCAEHVYKTDSLTELQNVGRFLLADAKKRNYPFGFIIQPYIQSRSSFHYRVQMVGNRVISCHLRYLVSTGSGSAWLASASKGSAIQYVNVDDIPKEISDTSRLATQACKLIIAGIDILLDRTGKVIVIEVNGTPFLHAVDVHPEQNELEVYRSLVSMI